MKKRAGILLPLFSLPSPYGIGTLGESAYRFVDFLEASGQSIWQILPIGPTGMGDSPYQTFSTYAGNPYYIDLEALISQGLLTREECEAAKLAPSLDRVDYGRQYRCRLALLWKAYQCGVEQASSRMEAFVRKNPWISDYALFMAIKDTHSGVPWWEWEEDLRFRKPSALAKAKEEFAEQMGFHIFLQETFFCQWESFKAYANHRGIEVMGDIPIYTAMDSADVWVNPSLFQLDSKLRPKAVAGCPPDGFSPDGQLWGNPLYDWDAHRSEEFRWWIARLAHCGCLYDRLRIDHFRGFDAYFSIPYGQTTAKDGHWEAGPGMELFRAVKEALPMLKIVAEDLGFITPSVKKLLSDCGFPGMKVLQFAFDGRDQGDGSVHLPHAYGCNCIAYTGTHDNQTLCGWLSTITPAERKRVRDYLCDYHTPDALLYRSLIALLHRSSADWVIIPLQDYLGLSDESRINTPSTIGENWTWRVNNDVLTPELARQMREMTCLYGREK